MKQRLTASFNLIEKHINQKHTSHLILFVIIATFFAVELPEINETEIFPDYFDHVVPYLESCQLDEIPNRLGTDGFQHETRGALKWWSLCLSDKLFDNERVIPFMFSLILIPVTFSFATHLTKSKVAGLITVAILVTSGTFTTFDTTATYEQSWVVFLLLSLIMVMRGSPFFMIIFFVLSVASKPIALIYVPVVFAFIYQEHSKLLAISFGLVLSVIMVYGLTSSVDQIGGGLEFNLEEFLHGFYNWWFYLNGSLLVAMTLPLVVWGLIRNRKMPASKIILVAIGTIILSVAFIDGFTTQLNHSYRFVPMIIFVGLGIAIIVTNFLKPKSDIFNIRKNQ